VDPQPPRLLRRIEPRQGVGRDDDAPAAIHRIDVEHPSGHRYRPEPAIEQRRGALPGGRGDQPEPGRPDRQAQGRAAPGWPSSQKQRRHCRGECTHRSEPDRRLGIKREIESDAAAENNWKPKDAAIAFSGERSAEAAERSTKMTEALRCRLEPFLAERYFRHRLSLKSRLQDRFIVR